MVIEVIVFDVESAIRAEEGGADRIELCDSAADGGTTPSMGTVETVVKTLAIDVFAMIRPRGGDFYYSNDEFHSMKRDIALFKRAGVKGVVFGILKPDGTIDKTRCAELIRAARPLQVTCHRAFDMTRDAFEALEDCISLGFDRILTSGRRAKAVEGSQLINHLSEKAAGKIKLIAGAGINEDNVQEIVRTATVREIHFPAMHLRESAMTYRNAHVTALGSEADTAFKVRTVDPEKVRKIRALAEAVES